MAGCPRAMPRRVGSRSRYIFSSRISTKMLRLYRQSRTRTSVEKGRPPRDLPTCNSQFSRSVCIFERQNPGTDKVFMRFGPRNCPRSLSLPCSWILLLLSWLPITLCSGNHYRFTSSRGNSVCVLEKDRSGILHT